MSAGPWTMLVRKRCSPTWGLVIAFALALPVGPVRAQNPAPGKILFYNAGSGEGAIARLDGPANYTFVSSIPGFARGWTQVVGASNGAVLFYNASTGAGATARIDNAGNYSFVGSIPDSQEGGPHRVRQRG